MELTRQTKTLLLIGTFVGLLSVIVLSACRSPRYEVCQGGFMLACVQADHYTQRSSNCIEAGDTIFCGNYRIIDRDKPPDTQGEHIMADTGKVTITAEMPKHLIQLYLQMIRNFDVEHFNEVELRITLDANMPSEEAEKLLARISPPYAYRATIKNNDGHHARSRIEDQKVRCWSSYMLHKRPAGNICGPALPRLNY
jgi:hypothetical protein